MTLGAGAASVVAPSEARASVGDCTAGDAAASYVSAGCRSVCVETGDEVVCELETLCPDSGNTGSEAWAIHRNANHDVVAWGSCLNATKFCCAFDEGATDVDSFELNGTDDVDYLSFTTDSLNLQPWDADPLKGYMRANEAGDQLQGSRYGATDYDDNLYGQDGGDVIYGYGGGDFLSGGDGGDELYGDDGNDTLWGGDGDDQLYGQDGVDRLCDASGYDVCATTGGNLMDGGNGEDKLWYNESENPNVPCPNILLDDTSTGGLGADECGDANDYGTTELPTSCTAITTEPAKCEGAS